MNLISQAVTISQISRKFRSQSTYNEKQCVAANETFNDTKHSIPEYAPNYHLQSTEPKMMKGKKYS